MRQIHIFQILFQIVTALIVSALLVSCGAGGGGDRAGVQTYIASGKVNGDTLQGVTIELGGKATAKVITDANGLYSFSGLSNGNYTFIPSKPGYIFSPVNTSGTVNGANVTVTDFKSAAMTYKLSGTVTGDVKANVTITLNDAIKSTAITSTTGDYSFTGLTNGSYTASAVLAGYKFAPANQVATIKDDNATFGNFISSAVPPTFSHAPPLADCVICHDGVQAKGVPETNHVPVNGKSCGSCHISGFTTFRGAIFDHMSQNTTVCTTCHVAGTYGAKTKPTGHIPTDSINCDTCHVGTGYVSFAGSTMNHNAVTTIVCSTCHNGAYVSQKGALGLGALPKNSGHIATGTKECGDCHLGRSSFLGGLFDHATASPAVAGRCNSCHDGIKALGKTNTATHNGTSAQCDTCHTNTQGYTTFAGAVFNHVNVANICGTCHLGQSAGVKTKTQNHIPTTGNACDSCHGTSNNYTSFVATGMTNAKIHNSSTWTTCLTCHNGSYVSQGTGIDATGARAMPNGHVSTSGAACSGCHATTAWLPAGFNHTGVVAGTCGTCHIPGTNGAKTKPAGTAHIPVSGNACDACHKSTALGGFATHTMNHTNVSTTPCATCHSATYAGLGVRVKPSGNGHIPTAITDPQDCKTCHTSTAAWTTETMNHNGIQGTTGITCITCHLSTAPYPGRMQKKSTGHTNGKDCSASGCHKPLGTRGTAYRSW